MHINQTFGMFLEERCQQADRRRVRYLFDGDADPHRVDGALDQDFLLIVAADHHRLQKQLFAAPADRHHIGRVRFPKSGTSRLWLSSIDVNLRAFTLSAPLTHLTSTSGLLCRSTTWEEKFSKHRAACRVARTAFRYGRRVAVWKRGTFYKQDSG